LFRCHRMLCKRIDLRLNALCLEPVMGDQACTFVEAELVAFGLAELNTAGADIVQACGLFTLSVLLERNRGLTGVDHHLERHAMNALHSRRVRAGGRWRDRAVVSKGRIDRYALDAFQNLTKGKCPDCRRWDAGGNGSRGLSAKGR